MKRLIPYIDPPSGWKYGFPKPLTMEPGGNLISWLIDNGYPEELAYSVSKYCRYWQEEVEDE